MKIPGKKPQMDERNVLKIIEMECKTLLAAINLHRNRVEPYSSVLRRLHNVNMVFSQILKELIIKNEYRL